MFFLARIVGMRGTEALTPRARARPRHFCNVIFAATRQSPLVGNRTSADHNGTHGAVLQAAHDKYHCGFLA